MFQWCLNHKLNFFLVWLTSVSSAPKQFSDEGITLLKSGMAMTKYFNCQTLQVKQILDLTLRSQCLWSEWLLFENINAFSYIFFYCDLTGLSKLTSFLSEMKKQWKLWKCAQFHVNEQWKTDNKLMKLFLVPRYF